MYFGSEIWATGVSQFNIRKGAELRNTLQVSKYDFGDHYHQRKPAVKYEFKSMMASYIPPAQKKYSEWVL